MRKLIPRHAAPRPCVPCVLATCLAVACAGPPTSGSASSGPPPGTLAVVASHPGPASGTLRALLGEFEVDCLWWPTAGAHPIASRGMLRATWDPTAEAVVGEFDGDLPGGFFPSLTRTAWDAVRGCYVSDWWDTRGNLLLPLSDGHEQSEGELVFVRGNAAASSIQVLTVLGKDEHRIDLSARAAGPGSTPHPLLRLRCRRRDALP